MTLESTGEIPVVGAELADGPVLPAEAWGHGGAAGATLDPDLDSGSFTDVFSAALRGLPCTVVDERGVEDQLPVPRWQREADAHDEVLLDRCRGATLDIGCGPGRMSAALLDRGHSVLGIDVVREAVAQTRRRGVPALLRDVFAPLPGEGLWGSALLADGNIGINGDPLALLARAADLVRPGGRVVVDVERPGAGVAAAWTRLRCGGAESRPFRWATVGADALVSWGPGPAWST